MSTCPLIFIYPINNSDDAENEQGVQVQKRFRHMQLDFTMQNRNQRRDDDGAASLWSDDAQVTVTGKGEMDGQNPHQFE